MICRRYIRTYKGELKDIFNFTLTKKHSKDYTCLFEREFAKYIGRKYAVSVCSGREGLELLLEAYGINEGDEVIFPAYTLKDLLSLVQGKGIKPVLVDIDDKTFNIDVNLVDDSITARTKAIIATHIFGSPCNIEKIMNIARKNNLIVIEDCAHSLGSQVNGLKTGSFADAAFFSFELTKPINTFGGGMVVTDDERVARYVKGKVLGLSPKNSRLYQKIISAYFERIFEKTVIFDIFVWFFYFKPTTKIISIVYRLLQGGTRLKEARYTSLQAFIGLKQLNCLDDINRARIAKAELLISHLDSTLEPQIPEKNAIRNFYFFVVGFKNSINSGEIRKEFIRNNIDVGIEGEIADDCSRSVIQDKSFPVARRIYHNAILLPMHEKLKDSEVFHIAKVCNKIGRFLIKGC